MPGVKRTIRAPLATWLQGTKSRWASRTRERVPQLVYGERVGTSSENEKPKFIFIDPENPPPGVDLSELPPGVDINELMTDAYVKSGELALMREQEDGGDVEAVEMTEEEWQEAQALTAELAQMAIDDYLFDTSDPD